MRALGPAPPPISLPCGPLVGSRQWWLGLVQLYAFLAIGNDVHVLATHPARLTTVVHKFAMQMRLLYAYRVRCAGLAIHLNDASVSFMLLSKATSRVLVDVDVDVTS